MSLEDPGHLGLTLKITNELNEQPVSGAMFGRRMDLGRTGGSQGLVGWSFSYSIYVSTYVRGCPLYHLLGPFAEKLSNIQIILFLPLVKSNGCP